MKKRKKTLEIKPKILIVDDEQSICDSLDFLLSKDYTLSFAKSGKEAVKTAKEFMPEVVLLDIRLPEINGLEVLSQIKSLDREVEVVMITALNTVSTAVEAIKKGAYDYITKPIDIEVIQKTIEKIFEKKNLKMELDYLKEKSKMRYQFEKIIGKSKKMEEIFNTIKNLSKTDVTVLISGESGTGKELVARAIHNLSARSPKLFVPVNCAAIPENLLESELFGYEKGAFTGAIERKLGKFEIANEGTIFLDEIGSMPLNMQAKLLRVLQDRVIDRVGGTKPIPVNVRIIAATNLNLKKLVDDEKFRRDLFYRLHVVPVHLPPLHEKKEDIPLLINHFLNIYNREFNKKVKFKKELISFLLEYNWPGNVRELQNLVERLVVLSQDRLIGKEHLPPEILKPGKKALELKEIIKDGDLNFKKATMRFEAAFIKKVLDRCGGKKGKAAKLMKVHRNTLLQLERKLKKAKLD